MKNNYQLHVIKEQKSKLNADILGINQLKKTGMGQFTLEEHQIFYYTKEIAQTLLTKGLGYNPSTGFFINEKNAWIA